MQRKRRRRKKEKKRKKNLFGLKGIGYLHIARGTKNEFILEEKESEIP